MIGIMFDTLQTALAGIDIRQRTFAAGALVFRRDDRVSWLHLVKQGRIHLVRPTPHGGELILQRAGPGALLAEASLFATHYHCDGRAEVASETLAISAASFVERLGRDATFARWWAGHLAREVQTARLRAELLALRTVAERLDVWLDLDGGGIPPRGERLRLAAELGVSPEALYREINRRRDKGLGSRARLAG